MQSFVQSFFNSLSLRDLIELLLGTGLLAALIGIVATAYNSNLIPLLFTAPGKLGKLVTILSGLIKSGELAIDGDFTEAEVAAIDRAIRSKLWVSR